MKSFISYILPKARKVKNQLDSFALITSKPWILLKEESNTKEVYIFRSKKELLISINGKVEKYKWEYLGHNNLIIENKQGSMLLKNAFYDEKILGLKIDGREDYMFLVDQNIYEKHNGSLNLIMNYLNKNTDFKLYVN